MEPDLECNERPGRWSSADLAEPLPSGTPSHRRYPARKDPVPVGSVRRAQHTCPAGAVGSRFGTELGARSDRTRGDEGYARGTREKGGRQLIDMTVNNLVSRAGLEPATLCLKGMG